MDHPSRPDQHGGQGMTDSVKQISDLMFRYAELFDTGRFDEFAAPFEHGRWHDISRHVRYAPRPSA
jgi:3-phenylpropionate/cinnamic acid dioxygenase small subunit